MLVINRAGDEAGLSAMEDYGGPLLQDRAEADVFGLWAASSYDLYIVDRAGRVAHAESGAHPADEPERYVELIAGME